MIKTPDVVNLDKSHVSFVGRRSDFGKKSKEVCTKPSRKSAGTGKRGCTKLSRNSSKAGESAARNRVGIRRGKGKAGARNQVGTRREDGGDAARNRVGIRRKQGRAAARNHVGIRRFAGGVLPVTASVFAIGQQGRGGSDFPRSGEKGGAGKEKSIRHKSDTFI